MQAAFHAVAIVALPLLTLVFVVVSLLKERPTGVRILAGAGAGVLGFGVLVLGFARGSSPTLQWAVPASCGVVSFALIADLRRTWKVVLAMALWTVALPLQYQSLVVHGGYAGSTALAERREGELRARAQEFEALLREAGRKDAASYPAGPLGDSPLLRGHEKVRAQRGKCRDDRWVIEPLWHTGITGLHAKRSEGVVLWYSGGPPATARLEWKPR